MDWRSNQTAIADRMFINAWTAMRAELGCRALRMANGDTDLADDLLADTAVKALVFMRRSPASITDATGFLFVVLRHVFLDSTRRNRSECNVLDRRSDPQARIDAAADPVPSTLRHVELQQSLERVGAAVASLPADQQRLFAFRFVDDLPYPLIADRLGINQPLARKRVELLRKQLRTSASKVA